MVLLRPFTLAILFGVCIASSGCFANLGYVPELLKSDEPLPAYHEVKTWALAVADGYDTRAILNRYAIYGGAVLGAAAVASIAALAAFDSGSSAVIGIPIGAGFLSSVAAFYQSDEKSRIYDLGTRYIKDLITASEARILARKKAESNPARALAEAETAFGRTKENVRVKHEALASSEAALNQAVKDAEVPAGGSSTEPQRQALEIVKSLQTTLPALRAEHAATLVEKERAERRRQAAQSFVDAWNHWQQKRKELEGVKATRMDRTSDDIAKSDRKITVNQLEMDIQRARLQWDIIRDHRWESEALCLHQDMDDVMRRVGRHISLLDPKHLSEFFTAIREKGKDAALTASIRSPDLTDLHPPVKSRCDDSI